MGTNEISILLECVKTQLLTKIYISEYINH